MINTSHNSRFAGLLNINEPIKPNVFQKPANDSKAILKLTTDEKKINSFRDYGFRERRTHRNMSEHERLRLLEEYNNELEAKKQLEKIEKQRKNEESLKIENFPQLVQDIKKSCYPADNQPQNYIETLKKESINVVSESNDPDLENLSPGWLLIKKDKETGKIIKKGITQMVYQPEISYDKIGNEMVDVLTNLHEKRMQQFIDINGYDTWEKMFKCPNWKLWAAEFDDDFDDESDEEYTDDYQDTDEEYLTHY